MIDLYFWPTPNGKKITIFLEEAGLPYSLHPVDIGKGDQFKPEFLAISPNNRIPAIVDNEPIDGGVPVSVFESGAILIYLAEKTGLFLPTDTRKKSEVLQWLMWQMGGVGPMFGQANHFKVYAAGKSEYAEERYLKESNRLLGVLDKRLQNASFVGGDYSIADMAIWPWVSGAGRIGITLDSYPGVKRWHDQIGARPAVQRGSVVGDELRNPAGFDDQAKKILFGLK